jgi:hypothetical protein
MKRLKRVKKMWGYEDIQIYPYWFLISLQKSNRENELHINLNKEYCTKMNKTYCSPLHPSQDL